MTRHPARILLADADAGFRALAAPALDGAGFLVLCAGDAAEAARLAGGAGGIDLLVTDPTDDLDGAGLAERLRELSPALPIVFATLAPDLVTERNWTPPCYCLAKPFAAAVLVEVVARMLRRGAPRVPADDRSPDPA